MSFNVVGMVMFESFEQSLNAELYNAFILLGNIISVNDSQLQNA